MGEFLPGRQAFLHHSQGPNDISKSNSTQVHPGKAVGLLGLLTQYRATGRSVGDPRAVRLEVLHPARMPASCFKQLEQSCRSQFWKAWLDSHWHCPTCSSEGNGGRGSEDRLLSNIAGVLREKTDSRAPACLTDPRLISSTHVGRWRQQQDPRQSNQLASSLSARNHV